jgi:hypothetical protein
MSLLMFTKCIFTRISFLNILISDIFYTSSKVDNVLDSLTVNLEENTFEDSCYAFDFLKNDTRAVPMQKNLIFTIIYY